MINRRIKTNLRANNMENGHDDDDGDNRFYTISIISMFD